MGGVEERTVKDGHNLVGMVMGGAKEHRTRLGGGVDSSNIIIINQISGAISSSGARQVARQVGGARPGREAGQLNTQHIQEITTDNSSINMMVITRDILRHRSLPKKRNSNSHRLNEHLVVQEHHHCRNCSLPGRTRLLTMGAPPQAGNIHLRVVKESLTANGLDGISSGSHVTNSGSHVTSSGSHMTDIHH